MKFEVEVAPIRDQLKKMKYGTMTPFDQSTPSTRRNGRNRNQNGFNAQNLSNGPSEISNLVGQVQRSQISLRGHDANSDTLEDGNSYYFWIDYIFEVEFIGGLMNYRLRIENVDRSFQGRVNLADIIEPR